jgi:hypothetical protein
MPMFRVVDLRSTTITPEYTIEENSPERAAEIALGTSVIRNGDRKNLVCRVYWQSKESLNMVRLYSQPEH